MPSIPNALRVGLLTALVVAVGAFPLPAQDAPFVTIWDILEDETRFRIAGTGMNYIVQWVEVEEVNGDWVEAEDPLSGEEVATDTHWVLPGQAGSAYRVTISGNFTRIDFSSTGFPDRVALRDVEQWGDISWSSMEGAFYGTSNLDISATDVPDLSGVESMADMFRGSSMNVEIGHWDVSNVTDMSGMFRGSTAFNQDLSGWDTSNVTDMRAVFLNAQAFDQDLSGWDTSNVTDMNRMFAGTHVFNQDLSGWDTSNVTDMSFMFGGSNAFNGDIEDWDTGNVTTMRGMFQLSSAFNRDLGGWNTENVTTMEEMFRDATAFNGDLAGWDTGNVTNMFRMFMDASVFNRDIGNWDTSSVEEFREMFHRAEAFNQDIGGWDMAQANNLEEMFRSARAFDQDLGGWVVRSVGRMHRMLDATALSVENYDRTLEGWSGQALQGGVNFGAAGLHFCAAAEARQSIIDLFNWTIIGDGLHRDCLDPLTLTVQVSDTHPEMGDVFELTTVVAHDGPADHPDVVVPVVFPSGRVEIQGGTVSHGTFTEAARRWDIGALAAGETAGLTLELLLLEIEPEEGP